MPNLVGIGNSQVPTNAMLGGLAYQDSVGEINLDKIKARTSDTAKDIFVYNTRKDSDGGAWRHRTQNTSWYNESASATRGARKEFPAVAIIVVEVNQVTIYDADDSNCSMWMEFNQSTTGLGAMVGYTGATITCCTMLNGVLMVGLDHSATQGNVSGLRIINFISERFDWKANIAGRNSNQTWRIIDRNKGRQNANNDGQLITDEYINDVAATVLANTPIDESTGLPNPTIAISTNQSLSVIRYDRAVNNKIANNSDTDVGNIDFTNDEHLIATRNNYNYVIVTQVGGQISASSYPSQYSTNVNYFRLNGTNVPPPRSPAGGGEISGYLFSNLVKSTRGKDFASADTYGLNIFSRETPSTSSLVSYITKDYNTGYMIGNVKAALLSSIVTENLDQDNTSNILTNGTDWTGASGTTAPNGWTSAGHAESAFTIDSGRLKIGNGSANNMTAMHQNVTTVVGTTYTLYFDYELHSSAQYAIIRAGTATLNGSLGYFYGTEQTSVSSSLTFEATTTSTNISVQLQSSSGNAYIWVDNMSVKAIGDINRLDDSDSVAGSHGLAVYGKVEKHPVAPGAELVGYRANSASQGTNFLKLPLKSGEFDLTGDWSINFWAKNNGIGKADYSGFEISPDDISSNSAYSLIPISMYIANDGVVGLRGMNNNANVDANGFPLRDQDFWRCFNIVHKNGRTHLYIDGELDVFKDVTHTNPSTAYALNIFRWTYSTTRYDGRRFIDFSLFRLSQTAPSAKQVKKMYEDEKKLFYDNAKCTIYGTSNDVKALAYDDINDVLHVGTSSGRSEFNRLNRINNTTTAVTTAISASDGLVAEQ